MKTLQSICVISGWLLMGTTASADDLAPAATTIEYLDSKVVVTTSLILPVKRCEAFQLLTDYDSIPSYVPGVLDTHHETLNGDTVRVWQTGEVTLLFIHVKVKSLLEVHEVPNQSITFKQLEGNLGSYSGTWNLTDDGRGTKVLYYAELTFRHFMPILLAKIILRDELNLRFSAIAREAGRRKSKGQFTCDDGNSD